MTELPGPTLLGFWLVSILEGARCAQCSDMYHVFVHQDDKTKVEAGDVALLTFVVIGMGLIY